MPDVCVIKPLLSMCNCHTPNKPDISVYIKLFSFIQLACSEGLLLVFRMIRQHCSDCLRISDAITYSFLGHLAILFYRSIPFLCFLNAFLKCRLHHKKTKRIFSEPCCVNKEKQKNPTKKSCLASSDCLHFTEISDLL